MHKTKLIKNTLFTILIICNGFLSCGSDSLNSSDHFDPTVRRVCANKVGECSPSQLGSQDEEVKRRVLVVQKRYISYGTLKRDLVPCTKPGASYYNCRAAGEANPYSRGCEYITACARDISEINS